MPVCRHHGRPPSPSPGTTTRDRARAWVGALLPGTLLASVLASLLAALLAASWPLPGSAAPAASSTAAVGLLTIDGAIGPASADHVVRGIARSAQQGHQLVILQMDTPGGLDTSMRTVIKAILASPVPVAAYVAPSGARAASAGTYLLYASHIAAMAPGTNLGAATPVEVGLAPPQPESRPGPGPAPGGQAPRREPDGAGKDKPGAGTGGQEPGSAMARKGINDAAAYLRGLAQLRGRNADWAERAVRESVSLTAEEALQQDVIEFVAADVPALLAQLDGRTVKVLGQERHLATRGAHLVETMPDWRTNVLGAITNPSVALLLMTIGIYGLVFEFMNPGAVAPGVIGGICLLLGLYALQLLPVSYAGLALIVLGLAFMGMEAFLPSFGMLGLGGIVAFVAGALMLIDTEVPGYGIPPGLVGTLAVASALLLFGTVRLAMKTRKRPVTSGAAGLVGATCTVQAVADKDGHAGWVQVEGELWRVTSRLPLRPLQTVRVVGRNGLTLEVVPVDQPEGA
ncbi:NfeD family protein [Massilia consociata]|uniref:Nodulation protein NfeD n=1 Tax=Massilia consociata TaxID=760117 RepID=A0ABV6FG80_9BURK